MIMPSLNLILIIKPRNINKASPPDDMSKIGLYNKPTNNPKAPKISRIIVNKPNFSTFKRLNSFFILGEIKYEIAYARKERLDIETHKINI